MNKKRTIITVFLGISFTVVFLLARGSADQVTCEYTINGDVDNYIEAEGYNIKAGDYVSVSGASYSNGIKMQVTQSSGSQTGGDTDTNPDYMKFNLKVTNCASACDFNIWTLVYGPDTGSDSLYLKVDSLASATVFFTTTGSWIWQNGATFSMANGVHTLWVKNRDDGASIDKLLITKLSTTPSGISQSTLTCTDPPPPPPSEWTCDESYPGTTPELCLDAGLADGSDWYGQSPPGNDLHLTGEYSGICGNTGVFHIDADVPVVGDPVKNAPITVKIPDTLPGGVYKVNLWYSVEDYSAKEDFNISCTLEGVYKEHYIDDDQLIQNCPKNVYCSCAQGMNVCKAQADTDAGKICCPAIPSFPGDPNYRDNFHSLEESPGYVWYEGLCSLGPYADPALREFKLNTVRMDQGSIHFEKFQLVRCASDSNPLPSPGPSPIVPTQGKAETSQLPFFTSLNLFITFLAIALVYTLIKLSKHQQKQRAKTSKRK